MIGFGVGNTAHAATLHTSVKQVDVADLSRHILEHAAYFREANHDVLKDAKVRVFVNDGRQHLQMTPPATYDLITLEPPPIAHAGVAALYSREFYQMARSRLTSVGYVSQWLPAYQVPAESSLAMVRAFLDVFPQSVLLSGAQAELLLIGTTAPRIELDPDMLAARLERERAVQHDLARVDLGAPHEIAGTLRWSGRHARASDERISGRDRRPSTSGIRRALWTECGADGRAFRALRRRERRQVVPARASRRKTESRPSPNLDLYLRLLQQAYVAPVAEVATSAAKGDRRILGSAYLGAVVPDSAEVHNLVGLAAMREGRVDDAVREFESALIKEPQSVNARANLGQIRYDQGAALLESRRFDAAAEMLKTVVDLMPDSAEAQTIWASRWRRWDASAKRRSISGAPSRLRQGSRRRGKTSSPRFGWRRPDATLPSSPTW